MIKDNVKRVLDNIAETAVKSGRNPSDITLVAVTKTVTAKEAKEVMDAGVLTLGENRVQSLLEKYEILKDEPCWHLIGHLQTNKVKYIADKVSMIHSVESLKLAEEINRKFAEYGRCADIQQLHICQELRSCNSLNSLIPRHFAIAHAGVVERNED